MPRVVGITNDEIQVRHKRVVELTQRNVPVELIAHQLGISPTHVYRIRAQQIRAKTPRRRFTTEEIEQVEAMLSDGCSMAEIARTIGRCPQTVSRRWRGRGWDRTKCAEWGLLMREAHQMLPGI